MPAQMESGGGSGQEVDLNLAPIIDCLTVLITFIMASATFLSIGLLDAGVSAAGAQAVNNATPPPVSVAVELNLLHGMTVKVSGKASSTNVISPAAGGWNYEELGKQLTAVHTRWPSVNAVTLSAENKIQYEDIVRTMESIRKTMPVVLLGGF